MYLIELQQISIKKLRKSAHSAFYDGFSAENCPKYREIPLFSQNREYLKITCHFPPKTLRIRQKNQNFQKSSCTFLDTSAKSNWSKFQLKRTILALDFVWQVILR